MAPEQASETCKNCHKSSLDFAGANQNNQKLLPIFAKKPFQMRFATFLLCLTLPCCVSAETLRGKVVGVSDGDTITVLDAANTTTKIRLAGIDAPEKSQAFGERSKQHLSDLVFAKAVTVDGTKKDRYGRTIGKVLADGRDANLEQVRAGFAWHYKQYEMEQSVADRTSYAQAEIDARSKKAGLWRDAHPIPPWDYRHGTGEVGQAKPLASGTCPCGSGVTCTGPRGGTYCLTLSGSKKYQ